MITSEDYRHFVFLICSKDDYGAQSCPSLGLRFGEVMFDPCVSRCLSSDVSEIKLVFSIPPIRPTPNIEPSWNVARPTPPDRPYDVKAASAVGHDALGSRAFWAKDIKVGFSNINANAEGVEGNPRLRRSIPASALSRAVVTSTSGKDSQGKQPTHCAGNRADGWPAFGRRGALARAKGASFAIIRRRPMSCARSSTTECR